jgi:hypothetical protein
MSPINPKVRTILPMPQAENTWPKNGNFEKILKNQRKRLSLASILVQ